MAQTHEGAIKSAAKLLNISVEEYFNFRQQGFKRCTQCKQWQHKINFCSDITRNDHLSTKCKICSSKNRRKRYTPKPRISKKGTFFVETRSGDKRQAMSRVNQAVRNKLIPNPNNIPCTDCSHKNQDRRHEYDHYLGYSAEHQLNVQSVCTICHRKRTHARRAKKPPTINTLPLEYKEVRGFPAYKVGNDGTLWSSWGRGGKGKITTNWKLVSADIGKKGYHRVVLYTGNKNTFKRIFLHRLILEVFYGPCPSGYVGCHLDDNPKNNCLANLKWDTANANAKRGPEVYFSQAE